MRLRSSCHCAGTVASSPHLTPASHLLILHLLLPLALRTNFDQVVCGPALGAGTMQCPEIDLDTQCRYTVYRYSVDTEYTRAPDNEYTNPCGGAQPSVLSPRVPGSSARQKIDISGWQQLLLRCPAHCCHLPISRPDNSRQNGSYLHSIKLRY